MKLAQAAASTAGRSAAQKPLWQQASAFQTATLSISPIACASHIFSR